MKKDLKLARLLTYILGRRPDEFGLVPDDDGFVAVKEVIKVLQEEKWPHVRPAHLETLPYRLPGAGIEMADKRIRASQRENLPVIIPAGRVPKQLFTCIRRKGYQAVVANGLTPQIHPSRVVLFEDIDMAGRVGRRRDAEPLVVTVQTTVAQNAGVQFERFGETIYLTARMPADYCRLPAPPKPRRVLKTEKDMPPKASPPQSAGSYTVDWDHLGPNPQAPKPGSKKSKQWRRERQRLRRMKRNAGDST